MSQQKTVVELLELALQREKDSYSFFKESAKAVDEPTVKMLFDLFAIEEERHIARVEFELLKTGKTIPDVDRILDMNDLDFVIDVPPELKSTYLDILAGAINKEQEAFEVYIDLLSTVECEETRVILYGLAEEEMRHKIMLEMKYNHASSQ